MHSISTGSTNIGGLDVMELGIDDVVIELSHDRSRNPDVGTVRLALTTSTRDELEECVDGATEHHISVKDDDILDRVVDTVADFVIDKHKAHLTITHELDKLVGVARVQSGGVDSKTSSQHSLKHVISLSITRVGLDRQIVS